MQNPTLSCLFSYLSRLGRRYMFKIWNWVQCYVVLHIHKWVIRPHGFSGWEIVDIQVSFIANLGKNHYKCIICDDISCLFRYTKGGFVCLWHYAVFKSCSGKKNCFEPLINNIVRNLVVNYETLNRCMHTH